VVKGVGVVLLDDGPLRVQPVDLGDGGQRVEKDGHEEDGALAGEANGGVGVSVEDGADDEGDDELCDHVGQRG